MLFARPGEGKTTVMLYGAYRAWVEQEAVVSFISPEMNAMEIGLKFDSFAFNISASELLSGTTSVTELARYESEIHSWLRQEQSGFFFYDTETFGRSFTTGDLAAIIRRDKPDVLCVDGLLFLEPVRRDFKDLRTRLSYVIAELKTLVLTTGVPMRIAHQANRQAVVTQRRTKAITVDELLPDIQHLAESDATGQFANRAFAIKSVRGRTFIGIRKNRNGPKDKFISCSIDPDRGVVDQVRYEMQSTQIEDLEDADAAVPRERPELPF